MNTKNIFIVTIFILIAVFLAYFFLNPQFLKNRKTYTDPTITKIISSGKLKIGTDATYPPMENMEENGNFEGYDIDLAREIATEFGVTPEFINVSFDTLFDSIKNDTIDLAISSITITPERSKTVLFSSPYLNAGQTIIVAETNTTIETKDDLTGKRIAVQEDTTSKTEALKLTDVKNLDIYTSDYSKPISNLIEGKIDAIIMDYPAAANLVQNNPGTKLTGEPFTSEYYGVIVKQGNDALITKINEVIIKLRNNGKTGTMETQWLRKQK